MRKRIASIVLSVCLCLSLLPTAALAEETTPATGVYTVLNEDGTPGGTYYAGVRPDADGPWGYWNIPYTSGSDTVLYYYDAETTSLSSNDTDISTSSVGDHLWKLMISKPAGSGDFTAGFELAAGGFPISFQDKYKPAKGLYYKQVREGHEDGSYIKLDKLKLPPM